MKEKRKYIAAETKLEILRKLSKDQNKMSDLCKEYGVQPSSVYQWQEELFSRGHVVFQNKRGRKAVDRSAEKIEQLEKKLSQREGAIVELLQDHCELKKSLGII